MSSHQFPITAQTVVIDPSHLGLNAVLLAQTAQIQLTTQQIILRKGRVSTTQRLPFVHYSCLLHRWTIKENTRLEEIDTSASVVWIFYCFCYLWCPVVIIHNCQSEESAEETGSGSWDMCRCSFIINEENAVKNVSSLKRFSFSVGSHYSVIFTLFYSTFLQPASCSVFLHFPELLPLNKPTLKLQGTSQVHYLTFPPSSLEAEVISVIMKAVKVFISALRSEDSLLLANTPLIGYQLLIGYYSWSYWSDTS